MNATKYPILLFGSLLLVTAGLFFRRDIAIEYHRKMMAFDWRKIGSGKMDYGLPWAQHRDALTSLGYYECFTLPIQHIEPNSVAWKQLSHELAKANHSGWISMRERQQNISSEVVIWVLPTQRDELNAIVLKYDVP